MVSEWVYNEVATSCATYPLTLCGAEEILPAGPQQARESRHAGGDLPLQQRTNSGADLQQVVCTDMSVQFHLETHTHILSSSCSQTGKWQNISPRLAAWKKKKKNLSRPHQDIKLTLALHSLVSLLVSDIKLNFFQLQTTTRHLRTLS